MPHHKGHNSGKKTGKKGRKQTPTAQGSGQPSAYCKKVASKNNHPSRVVVIENGGYYAVYKQAILKFLNWMARKACPNLKMSAVNDYLRGAQQVLNHNRGLKQHSNDFIVAPPEIMASLASSIRVREKIGGYHFGLPGDTRHQYITDVLQYCECALRFANRMAALAYKARDVQKGVSGRFDALPLNDEEMEWEEIDRAIKEGNWPEYTGVKVREGVVIPQALLKGDDQFQAIALLCTMEDLMGTIKQQYGLLKDYMRGTDCVRETSSCMQLVMESAAVANVAVDCVLRAENELGIDHPHLSSFYHVLALVFMDHYVADINEIRKSSPVKNDDPHMALDFVAELVECCFKWNRNATFPSIVERFVKKSGVRPQDVEQTAKGILARVIIETNSDIEFMEDPDLAATTTAAGFKPCMWLSQFENIGSDCCILNTHKIVQVITGALKDGKAPLGGSENWGPSFHESENPAYAIRGDLDELLSCKILPEIYKICYVGTFDHAPDLSRLMPVLGLLNRHVSDDATKPSPIAMTFGLHATLMSIFVLQGDGDLARIAASAKQSYNTLFHQLRTVSDRSNSPQPHFCDVVENYVSHAELAKPIPSSDIFKLDDDLCTSVFASEAALETQMLAFWNPLIGGGYMLYVTYLCSISLGSTVIDSFNQLTFVLHLYHGLKMRDPTLDLPILEHIDKVFQESASVWVGGKPEKGACCKAFWTSMGMHAPFAARLASGHVTIADLSSLFCRIAQAMSTRKLQSRCFKEFSASYPVLVFGADANRYTNGNSSKGGDSMVDLLTKINITRDAMRRDGERVLSVNFPAVGSILLEFMNALFDHMGWSSMVQDDIRTYENLSGKTLSGKDVKHVALTNIWGRLLSCMDRDLTKIDVDKVSAFTKSFFEKVEKSRYIFFAEEESISML